MFENHFGFIRRPFTAGPDVELFASNEAADTAFTSIEYCLRGGQGIAVLTAASGVGKTMFCHRLINELRDAHTISFLPSPGTSSRLGLLQAIYFGLGKRVKRRHAGISDSEMRLELIDAVGSLRVHSTGIVLLIDEAHLLDSDQLEEIRIISSFTERGQPLVRPLLCGNPELEERLLEPGLKALSQRIRSQHYLQPLTRAESNAFIEDQLVRAGARNRSIFEPEAIQAIVEASDGNPRCLNQLCDQSLYLAAREGSQRVTARVVTEALDELVQLPLSWKQPLSRPSAISTVEAQAPSAANEAGLSSVEIGAPEPTGSVVEFGSLDDGPATSPSSIEFGSEEDVYPTRPIETEHEAVTATWQPPVEAESEGNFEEEVSTNELERAEEISETLRRDLPAAPVPFSETVVDDRNSIEIEDDSEPLVPVDDYRSLQPRFDNAVASQDLLPATHSPLGSQGVAAHQLAAAAARSQKVSDRWANVDQARATTPLTTEPISVSAEEKLLSSCVETRREIASMLDSLETHMSESLADQYDVVMPEAEPHLRVPFGSDS